MQTPTQSKLPDDEVSLADIWQTLMRRKKIFILTFFTVVIAAGIYLLFSRPVYESRALVLIGQVGQVGKEAQVRYVEDIRVLQERLKAEYANLDVDQKNRSGAENIISLTLTGYNAQKTYEDLVNITNILLDEHRALYRNIMSPLRDRQVLLSQRLDGFKVQLSHLDMQINQLRSEQSTDGAILSFEKGNVAKAILEIEEKLTNLELAIIQPQSIPTQLLGPVIKPASPIKPRTRMVVSLSILIGLISGIFVAFFTEFIVKARAGIQE